jgi:soluble lytic murein transglycosylase-like protein
MLILLLLGQVVTRIESGGVFATNMAELPGSCEAQAPTIFDNYDGIIRHYSAIYGVDPELVRLVIEKESQFNPRAVSKSGAIGLMQLMPETAQALGVANPYNPRENIMGGVKFLRRLLDMFNGDIAMALAAYHAGPNTVKRLGRIPAIPETVDYVEYIMSRYGNAYETVIQFSLTQEGAPFFTNRPK